MNIFPAQPDTYVIEHDASDTPPRYRLTPVIGWCHVQASMAFPITAMAHGGLTHGKAILHGIDGYVTDPIHKLVFEDPEEWMTFMRTAKKKADSTMEPQPEAEDEDLVGRMPDPEPEEPEIEELAEDNRAAAAEVEPKIAFGKKAYKSNSYWAMEAHSVVFAIAPDEKYPVDGRVAKVTRDQYNEMRKMGFTIVDAKTYVPGAADEDEDDNDAMSLV